MTNEKKKPYSSRRFHEPLGFEKVGEVPRTKEQEIADKKFREELKKIS